MFAEAVAAQLVVSGFIDALKKHDQGYIEKYADLSRIEKASDYEHTQNSLEGIFGHIDLSALVISNPIINENTKTFSVELTYPVSYIFELQHQNAAVGKGDFYRIIRIRPSK